MTAEDLVMVIDKPHFTVRLHRSLLEVDLKGGMKKELEDVLEAKPGLRKTLGFLFQTIIPLDVPLKDIELVKVNKKGEVKLVIPSRRDIVIPLKPKEGRSLADKLNELIPVEKDLVMVINKPHFRVRLHRSLLEVDLKAGIRKELEDFLESKPIIRENLGFLFQTIVPLDVLLRDIESVGVNEKGQVNIVIPLRRDIVIPLKSKESKRLVEKMNELIPIEKAKFAKLLMEAEKARIVLERAEAEAYERVRRDEIRGR